MTSIPTTAAIRLTVAVPFRCGACGCRASVRITERGLSAVGSAPWFAKAGAQQRLVDAAYERARARARGFARASAATLPCPRCQHRSVAARLRAALSLALSWLVLLAVAGLATGAATQPWQRWYERAGWGALALAAIAVAIGLTASVRRSIAAAHASARFEDVEPAAG